MRIINICVLLLLFLFRVECMATGRFMDFDTLPTTSTSGIPGDGGGWEYGSDVTNPEFGIIASGWRKTVGYAIDQTYHESFYAHLNTNNDHLGYSTYGYVEIDSSFAVSGKSLKYTVTGGYKPFPIDPVEFGSQILSKEDFLTHPEYVDDTGETIGSPYFYTDNGDTTSPYVNIEEAQGANRLSIYIWTPSELVSVPTDNAPGQTIGIGPYSFEGTNHYYNSAYVDGGGWTHVQVDAHPRYNNAWTSADLWPYPSSSTRNLGADYFNEMRKFYISIGSHEGIKPAPYSIWIDEIEFLNDTEPQNEETIGTLAVTYQPNNKLWYISFTDKYANIAYSRPVYELRYSFAPITNANWSSATPALIQDDARYTSIKSGLTTIGEFKKNNGYYKQVFAPFKLLSADEDTLAVGSTIYFAVKDVGQAGGDGQAQRAAGYGRDYLNYPELMDYEGDYPALSLIKRMSYRIGGYQTSTSRVYPGNAKQITGTGRFIQ